MEKIAFTLDHGEIVDFYILEQTRINNINYLLVTTEEEGDGEALILKDLSLESDLEANYQIVSEEEELNVVADVFESLLDDVSFTTEE